MHIPDGMMHGTICPVTAAVSAVGIACAAYYAHRSPQKPAPGRFATVAAFIFAAQMINFPIQAGTSGHLLGGILAVTLLGIPFGMLALALVVTIQCLLFSDGGITVLGANVLNMALVGTGCAGLLLKLSPPAPARSFSFQRSVMVGSAAWCSIICAAFFCCLELAWSGTISFRQVIGPMLGIHALIGVAEAGLTVLFWHLFAQHTALVKGGRAVTFPLLASGIIGIMLVPFASSYPDGLEWVAEQYRFLHETAPAFVSPLPDYVIPGINNNIASGVGATLVGICCTFIAGLLCAYGIAASHSKKAVL